MTDLCLFQMSEDSTRFGVITVKNKQRPQFYVRMYAHT